MRGAIALLAIARADFRERVRRYGFLVTVGFTVLAAYAFLPPNHSRYATLQFGGHRGIYNSAYVGCLVAMLTTVFLSLAGFYVVKNAVERDRHTGVGAILAGTPITRLQYVLGKALSNLAVLATMAAVVTVASAAMQLLRGEDSRIDPWQLLAPSLILTLPALAVVAAVGVLFEVTPVLKGGLGNVAYFVAWNASLATSVLRRSEGGHDFSGFGWVLPRMAAACHRAFPDYDPLRSPMSMGANFKASGTWDLQTFIWHSSDWGGPVIAARLLWVLVALALAGLAALLFDRFDAAAIAPSPLPRPGRSGWPLSTPGGLDRKQAARRPRRGEGTTPIDEVVSAGASVAPITDIHLTPLSAERRFGLLPMVRAELVLMLRGLPWAWWLVTVGLMIATCLAPLWAARQGVLTALWIWPLLIWSALGNRETRHGTHALIFSVPRPVSRLVLAQWLAGAALSLGMASGVAARLAAAGDGIGLAALIVGGLFVPSLAVGLGAWSGSGKLFEILYLILWYMGPLNRVPGLDYTGGAGASAVSSGAWTIAGASFLVIGLAGRARRARS